MPLLVTYQFVKYIFAAKSKFEHIPDFVNNNDFFDVITKDSPIYLEENGSTGTSLSATAGGANDFKVIVSYEEIS